MAVFWMLVNIFFVTPPTNELKRESNQGIIEPIINYGRVGEEFSTMWKGWVNPEGVNVCLK